MTEKTLQEQLTELNERGYSDSEIARSVGATQPTISRLRRGDHADTSYTIGKAIETLHAERMAKIQQVSSAAPSGEPMAEQAA